MHSIDITRDAGIDGEKLHDWLVEQHSVLSKTHAQTHEVLDLDHPDHPVRETNKSEEANLKVDTTVDGKVARIYFHGVSEEEIRATLRKFKGGS